MCKLSSGAAGWSYGAYGAYGALVVAGLAPAANGAMTWQNANSPDANTLVLYHVNEAGGTTLADSSSRGNNATLPTAALRATEATGNWLAGGGGTYLQDTNDASGKVSAVTVTGVDWNKGLTASFWYRVRSGGPSSGEIFHVEGPGVSGAPRPRAFFDTDVFGASGNGRLRLQSTTGNNGLTDYGSNLVWRHLAMVFDPAGNGGTASDGGTWKMFLDNAQVGSTITDTTDLTVTGATTFQFVFGGSTFGTVGSKADFDELLIENGVVTNFANGINAPEPAGIALVAPVGLLLARRRRRA